MDPIGDGQTPGSWLHGASNEAFQFRVRLTPWQPMIESGYTQLYEQVGGFGYLLAITQDPDDPPEEIECLQQLLKEEVGPRVAELTGRALTQTNR